MHIFKHESKRFVNPTLHPFCVCVRFKYDEIIRMRQHVSLIEGEQMKNVQIEKYRRLGHIWMCIVQAHSFEVRWWGPGFSTKICSNYVLSIYLLYAKFTSLWLFCAITRTIGILSHVAFYMRTFISNYNFIFFRL